MASRSASPLLSPADGPNTPVHFSSSTSSLAPLLTDDEEDMIQGYSHRKRTFWTRNKKRIIVVGSVSLFLLLVAGVVAASSRRERGPTLRLPDQPLLVSLPDYGTFQGTTVVKKKKDGTNYNLVDAWLGVEYSLQPEGERRFAPPDWPKEFNGTRNATEYGKACMQNWGWNPAQHTESCLTFNLYRPHGVPHDQKLPVLVWFHGGSFVVGDGKSFDSFTFVAKSKQPLMAINVQYRLGALGNFPSKAFEEEGLLNLGARDQRMALEFLQKYLTHFGGDPDRVTIGGQSAGAHSVGIQLFSNYGESAGKKLFSHAILASGSPTARSFAPPTYPLYERYYKDFMDEVKCSTALNTTNAETLKCLRDLPIRTLRSASGKIFNASNRNITWPWQPNSPGPLIEKSGSVSGIDGTFFKVPVLTTSTTDEGKGFVPHNLATNEDFMAFMANLLPGLTAADLTELEQLYPDPTDGKGPYAEPVGKFISAQYERVSAAYGDYSYICPVQETAHRMAIADVPVYKARFNAPNGGPAHMGVPHAADHGYFTGHDNAQYPEISEIYHSYYASFVVSGDPNTYRSNIAPKWDRYKREGSEQLVVSSKANGGVAMEKEEAGIRMEQCKWWRDPERMRRINK